MKFCSHMYKNHLVHSHGLNFLLTLNISKLPSVKYSNKHLSDENPKARALFPTSAKDMIKVLILFPQTSGLEHLNETCSKDMTTWVFPV